jgi:predicted DNA-binding transcriptional regulator YafY
MGKRPLTEKLLSIILAFHAQARWEQVALARKVGLSVDQLRDRLRQLQKAGMKLKHTHDANTAAWTMEQGIFPDGIVFQRDDVWALLVALQTAPSTKERTMALARIFRVKSVSRKAKNARLSDDQEPVAFLGELTGAMLGRKPVRVKYVPTSGEVTERVLSVHFTTGVGNLRFLATDHGDDKHKLKWFRVGRLRSVTPAPAVAYRDCPRDEVLAYEQDSAWGYHGNGPAVQLSFVATEDAWRILESNMPAPAITTKAVKGGVRVTVRTTAVGVWARYLIGYIGAVTPETRELKDEMLTIVHAGMRAFGLAKDDDARAEPSAQLLGAFAPGQRMQTPVRAANRATRVRPSNGLSANKRK